MEKIGSGSLFGEFFWLDSIFFFLFFSFLIHYILEFKSVDCRSNPKINGPHHFSLPLGPLPYDQM